MKDHQMEILPQSLPSNGVKRSLARSFLYHFLYVAVVIIGFAYVTVMIWEFYPYNVLELKKEPLTILTPLVPINGTLEYRMEYCKESRYSELHSVTELAFVDHLIHLMPSYVGPIPVGCHVGETGGVVFTISVPKITPGKYHLDMQRTYKVNPFRTITIKASTEDFIVYDPNVCPCPPKGECTVKCSK